MNFPSLKNVAKRKIAFSSGNSNLLEGTVIYKAQAILIFVNFLSIEHLSQAKFALLKNKYSPKLIFSYYESNDSNTVYAYVSFNEVALNDVLAKHLPNSSLFK